MIVVAVVVTIYTAGAAAEALGAVTTSGASAFNTGLAVLSGGSAAGVTVTGTTAMVAGAAIGAAAGSIASQVVGMATGNVEKFSWKAVGQSARAAGITAGVGSYFGPAPGATSATANASTLSRVTDAVVRAGVSSAVTQAIQGKWSWREVGAATVSAGAGYFAGQAVADVMSGVDQSLTRFAVSAGAAVGGSWASSQVLGLNTAETRSRLGVAFVSGLAQGMGSVIGESIGNGPSQQPESTFARDHTAREAAADPYGLEDFAIRTSSSGIVSRTSFTPNAGRSAGDMELDRLVLGDRLAALAEPQSAGSLVPDAYLARDGSGHLMPQAPVVIEGQRNVALPEMDHSGYFGPGFVTSSYQQAVGMMSDANAPWYERGIGLAAAIPMVPIMLTEEAGRGLLNVPHYARQMGQNAAQFKLARTTEERVVAGLSLVSNGASAFVGMAPVVPSSVSLRPILTAQEMAVAQFSGAEATAAARATYRIGNTGSATLAETGAVDRLLYGARVGEGLPGGAGVAVPGRPTPAQLEALTVKHDVEFAVTYKLGPGQNGRGGQYFLYSGEKGAVDVPLQSDMMLIYHTHPGGTAWASPQDMNVMRFLEAIGSPQRSSQIVPVGKDVVRFSKDVTGSK